MKKITTRNKLQRPSDIIASNGWQNKLVGQAVDGYFHKTGVRPPIHQNRGQTSVFSVFALAPGRNTRFFDEPICGFPVLRPEPSPPFSESFSENAEIDLGGNSSPSEDRLAKTCEIGLQPAPGMALCAKIGVRPQFSESEV